MLAFANASMISHFYPQLQVSMCHKSSPPNMQNASICIGRAMQEFIHPSIIIGREVGLTAQAQEQTINY